MMRGFKLSFFRSQISMRPSFVTEANTEDVCGDHWMSFTYSRLVISWHTSFSLISLVFQMRTVQS